MSTEEATDETSTETGKGREEAVGDPYTRCSTKCEVKHPERERENNRGEKKEEVGEKRERDILFTQRQIPR